MDSTGDEYSHYWEMDQELDNWDVVEALVNYSSNSPMGSNSSVASSLGAQDLSSAAAAEDMGLEGRPTASPSSGMLAKNILTERNRRKRFNDSLYALRSVVPTITKLDKVSIVKDAIDYIEHLQQQEGAIMAEIYENGASQEVVCGGGVCHDADGQVQQPQVARLLAEPRSTPKKKKKNQVDDVVALAVPTVASSHNLCRHQAEAVPATNRNPLQLEEMRVVPVKERTWLVSLTYKKDKHTMLSLCELFAFLNLKTLSGNITALSDTVQQMVMVECDELDIDMLQERIHSTIAGQKLQRNSAPSPYYASSMSCC